MSTDETTAVAIADQYPELRAMIGELAILTENANEVDDSFVMSVMEAILSAQTADDIFEAQSTSMIAGKDYIDRPFIVRKIEWRKGSPGYIAQGGFPFYAIMTVLDLGDGIERVINCGGKTFVAVARKLESIDYFNEDNAVVIKSFAASEDRSYLQLHPFKFVKQSGKR